MELFFFFKKKNFFFIYTLAIHIWPNQSHSNIKAPVTSILFLYFFIFELELLACSNDNTL